MRIFLLVAVVACSHPQPVGPFAPGEPVLVVPVKPIGVERVDEGKFLEMLKRDDWSDMIDPMVGLVSLIDSNKKSGRRDQVHEVSVHRFCSQKRAALAAKFEALELAASLIADTTTRDRCLGFQQADEPGLSIECHHDGQLKNFRFGKRGTRYVLIGIARVAEGSISAADEARYETALRGNCDPRDRDHQDSVDDVLQGSVPQDPDDSQLTPNSFNVELE